MRGLSAARSFHVCGYVDAGLGLKAAFVFGLRASLQGRFCLCLGMVLLGASVCLRVSFFFGGSYFLWRVCLRGAWFPNTLCIQVVKNAASSVKILSSHESSVLARVLIEQSRQVQVDIGDMLIGPEEDT